MHVTTRLGKYPALERWFKSIEPGSQLTVSEDLAWQTCVALQAAPGEESRRLALAVSEFLLKSVDPLGDFLGADTICQQLETTLADLFSDLGQIALQRNQAESFLMAMQNAAAATGLVVLRFLAAWAALNSGKLELCVDECEKITEPFAPIYTIQGQALLELGRVDDATDALGVAVRLAPQEILAWFQLAKAHHVAGRATAAWHALEECQKLAPGNDEIALFMSIVALEPALGMSYTERAWGALRPRLAAHATNPIVATNLMRLALKRGRRDDAERLVGEADWRTMNNDAAFTRALAPMLKGFQERGWLDVAAAFLQKVAPT